MARAGGATNGDLLIPRAMGKLGFSAHKRCSSQARCYRGPLIRVLWIDRARGKFYSIEQLFSGIQRCLPIWVCIVRRTVPRSGASLKAIFGNIVWTLRRKHCDLVHVTGDIHYAVLGVWTGPVVLTIHDVRFVDEARGWRRYLFLWFWLYLPCLRADCVTVISESTKEKVESLCPIVKRKTRVVENCVGSLFRAKTKPWPQGPVTLLHIGTTANKNLARVVQACSGLAVRLHIVGELSKEQRDHLARSGVEYLAFDQLSEKQVVDAYEACDIVIFVSTYEGFGLPIIEGQTVGRPVITSDIAPMREIAGGAAILVDPYRVEAIRTGLMALVGNASLRERLVEDGFRNVLKYSASETARKYADVYREVLGL